MIFFVDRKPLFAQEKVRLSSIFDTFSLLMNLTFRWNHLDHPFWREEWSILSQSFFSGRKPIPFRFPGIIAATCQGTSDFLYCCNPAFIQYFLPIPKIFYPTCPSSTGMKQSDHKDESFLQPLNSAKEDPWIFSTPLNG